MGTHALPDIYTLALRQSMSAHGITNPIPKNISDVKNGEAKKVQVTE